MVKKCWRYLYSFWRNLRTWQTHGHADRQTPHDGISRAYASHRAAKTLGMINRTFVNRDSKIILKLYQSLVRPILEYCVQAWRPYLKKDIALLEKVQKRATRLMTKERSLSYEERLQRFGLTSLETRRLWDLIEVFKIFKGFELNIHNFSLCRCRT